MTAITVTPLGRLFVRNVAMVFDRHLRRSGHERDSRLLEDGLAVTLVASERPVALLLFNLGGPDTLADVEPFLVNLFSDREIIELPGGPRLQPFFAWLIAKKRGPSVRENYRRIGGGSPQLRLTRAQGRAVEERLNARGGPLPFVHRDALLEAIDGGRAGGHRGRRHHTDRHAHDVPALLVRHDGLVGIGAAPRAGDAALEGALRGLGHGVVSRRSGLSRRAR